MKVFVNPGHMPGVDPGAVNEKLGINEADIALKAGKLVQQYLEAAGCEVKLLQSHNLMVKNLIIRMSAMPLITGQQTFLLACIVTL